MPAPLTPIDAEHLRQHLGGRFAIHEPLGSGASGTVFRATTLVDFDDVPAGAAVALKVLRPELATDEKARERLRREAELGHAIDDRHVVTIHGYGDADGGAGGPIVFLVTEYVRGRSLRDLLHDAGPVIGDLARRIGEQAALGLAALHDAGIVHRDVKPENVLITDDGAEIRLADLGLARPGHEAGPYGSSGGFHGSLAYAAPELLRGRTATPQSDLYALGVVLHEVVTGQHPFAAHGGGDAMLHAHLHVAPPRPSHLQPQVSAFLEAVIAELLEKDTARRPSDARAIARILQEGEASTYWRVRERMAPVLASRRRLLAMRRSRHTAFVDRAAEQRRLDELLADALDRRGRAVLVHGHGGSGRRRLVDECVDRWLDEHAGLVFFGDIADDDPSARLGTPFPQILIDALLDGDDDSSPRVHERLQARVEQLGIFDQQEARQLAAVCSLQVALAPAARADLLVRALVHLASNHRGTVLRIDRVEDLSATGRLVVERLVEQIASLPLLLLLVGPSNTPRLPGLVELAVGNLGREAFVEFGRQLFRDGEGDDDLLDRAWAPFSGQPRALLDALEELALERRLLGRAGDYHGLDPSVRAFAPARPALQQLRDRVVAMPPAPRYVVQAAAVLGDRFALADLAALTGRPEFEVLESLAAFDNRIFGVERGHGRFRHRDYRLATIAATPPEARRRMHRDAAWVLEDRGAAQLEIGLHLSRAAEDQACLDPLLDGLEDLVRTNARKTAIRVSERLHLHLNRLPRSPENLHRRLRWLLASGESWLLVDNEDKCFRAFRKAVLIAQHLGRTHERARAMVGLADLAQHKGRFLTSVQLLTQAAELVAGDDTDSARLVRARALLVHGRVMAYQGQSVDALKLTTEGLRTLPRGHATLEAHLRIDQARWLALRLRFGRALSSLERSEQLLADHADPLAELRLHLHRGRMLGTLGDLEAAELDLRRAYELALRLGDERMVGRARLFRAEFDAYVGDHEAARPLLLDARRSAQAARDPVTESLAEALLLLGSGTDSEDFEVPLSSIPIADLGWLLVQGVRRTRGGDRHGGRALLREAAQLERIVRVHLLMRLAILRATGRDVIAARLIRAVASRRPAGSPRRRFLAYADRVRI